MSGWCVGSVGVDGCRYVEVDGKGATAGGGCGYTGGRERIMRYLEMKEKEKERMRGEGREGEEQIHIIHAHYVITSVQEVGEGGGGCESTGESEGVLCVLECCDVLLEGVACGVSGTRVVITL